MNKRILLGIGFLLISTGFRECNSDIVPLDLCSEVGTSASSANAKTRATNGGNRRQNRREARRTARGAGNDINTKIALGRRTTELDAVVCMGGYPTPTPTPQPGVPPASPCSSGTLATPNRIVTAKHMNPEGGKVRFTFGDQARWNPEGSVIGTRCWEFRHNHVTGVSRAAQCCKHVQKPNRSSPPEQAAAYQNYLATCSDVMGNDEAIISDLAVYELSERVTNVTPIPVARKTPGNDNNRDYFKGIQGYIAGHGRTEDDPYSGMRRWGATILNESFEDNWMDGDGDEVKLQFFSSQNNGDAATLAGDSGGPVFANYSGVPLSQRRCEDPADWKIIGTIYLQGNGGHSMTFDAKTAPALEKLMDPDGDGIDVGNIDAHSAGAVDSDGDGLAEYFVNSRTGAITPGQDNCPAVNNPDQTDKNGDGVGDACAS